MHNRRLFDRSLDPLSVPPHCILPIDYELLVRTFVYTINPNFPEDWCQFCTASMSLVGGEINVHILSANGAANKTRTNRTNRSVHFVTSPSGIRIMSCLVIISLLSCFCQGWTCSNWANSPNPGLAIGN